MRAHAYRRFRPHHHARWIAAYADTGYRVLLPTATEDVRIGQRAPALERWMEEHGARSAAIVTACNPRSRLLGPCGNRRAQRALLDVLRASYVARGHAILPACNRALHGDWPDEPGFAVGGLSVGGARRLGARFGQHAVVWVGFGRNAELVWVR